MSAILYRGGLRINEALDLFPKDLDLEAGAVRVLHGKGGKARTVGIDVGACAVVDRWLAIRRELGVNGTHPALCTLEGARMGDAYIRVLLPRLGRKAGIEKRVHAHGLRHTHAAELRVEGVDIGIISKQLGHRSIATTARYLDHIAPQDVIAAMRGRAWSRPEGLILTCVLQRAEPKEFKGMRPQSPRCGGNPVGNLFDCRASSP